MKLFPLPGYKLLWIKVSDGPTFTQAACSLASISMFFFQDNHLDALPDCAVKLSLQAGTLGHESMTQQQEDGL